MTTEYKERYETMIKNLDKAKTHLCVAFGCDMDDCIMNGELGPMAKRIEELIEKAKRHMEESE